MSRFLLGCAALAIASGCADKTAILVEVTSTDLAVPADVDTLRFEVTSDTGRRVDETFTLSSGWPQSLSILPASEADSVLTVTVTASRGATMRVRRVVRAEFVRGETRVVQVELSRACDGVVCPDGLDCETGTCPLPSNDGGVDGGVRADGGPRDGGPADAGEQDAGVDGGTGTIECALTSCAGFLVISELVTSGTSATDEYVEIHNRGTRPIDVRGIELRYRSQSGTESTRSRIAVSTVVPPGGYLLFAGRDYRGVVDVTERWAVGIANNGTVFLSVGAETLDLVGCADATSAEGAAIPGSAPCATSCERKASATSDAISLASGGAEERAGNGYDTNDNAADFVQRTTRDPQTATSPREL